VNREQSVKNPKKKVVLPPPVFPADPVGAEFCQLFWTSTEGWDWIYGNPPAPGVKTQWETEKKFPIQPLELWHRFLDPHEAIGVRFRKLASYLLIDIDRHSPNHPANNPGLYMGLIYALREIGLIGYFALTSSWSKGIHLIFPLPKPVNAMRLACRARLVLESWGFKIKSGELELFPNTKPYAEKGKGYSKFNGHRLPLQPGSGSYLLDAALEPYSDLVEDLLKAFREGASRQDMERLESGLKADYEKYKKRRYNSAENSAGKWRRYLESVREQGWTGYGQTNSILLFLSAYARVFLRLEGEELANTIVNMATSAPGYQQYCRHQDEIERRAKEVAQSAERYYWKLGDEPCREGTYAENFGRDSGQETGTQQQAHNNIANFYTAGQAQERIRLSMAHLEESGTLPSTASARSAAIITTAKQLTGKGISKTTLQKNLDLWHPNHYQPQSGCVQPLGEPIPAEIAPPDLSESKTPETAQGADVRTPPIYEGGEGVAVGGAAPQEPAPSNDVLEGESEGEKAPSFEAAPVHNNHSGDDTLAPVETTLAAPVEPTSALAPVEPTSALAPATLAPVPTQANTLEPANAPLTPADIIRITKLRLELGQRARRAVQTQVKRELRLISGSERSRLEQAEKMRLYLESGEPVLVAEADLWRWQQAAATSQSPEAEPEPHPEPEPQALANGQVSSSNPTTPEPTGATTPLGRSASSLTQAERSAALDALPAASTSNSAADETESDYYREYLETPSPADFECPWSDSQPDPESSRGIGSPQSESEGGG